MTAIARTLWLLFWRPSKVLGDPMERVADVVRSHPLTVALVFADGLLIGVLIGWTWPI